MQPLKLIIGSVALKHWFPDYEKVPGDIDYIVSHIPSKEFRRENTEYFTSPGMNHIININKDPWYVDPDLLYTIKCSHLSWEGKNGHWWHHLKDAVFLKNKGCKINQEVYDILYKEWQILHGDKSNISLNKAVEQFFKDGVRREYDHDWLHEHFKASSFDVPIPAYKYALKTSDSPMMDKYIFSMLDKKIQFYTGLEEMFVVAFERNISLPNAYKSLVTRMTKGWWTQFMIENAEILLDGFQEEKFCYKDKVNKLRSGEHNDFNRNIHRKRK